MAPNFLRLVWGTPPVPAGRWHAGLVNLKIIPSVRHAAESPAAQRLWHEYRRHRLHLSLRGLLAWTTVLALAGYLAAAGWLLHRLRSGAPEAPISYLDLALPSRWGNLERFRGEALIAQGRAALAEGRFSEGFAQLRLGLARHPADHGARLALARLYVALRLGPHAGKLLREGLAFGYPGRDYIDFALTLAVEANHPSRRIELCQTARALLDQLPAAAQPIGDRAWLDRQLVQSLLAAGRGDEALALLENAYPETDAFRREITVLRLLETGRAEEASILAERWVADSPRSVEALRLLTRAHREAANHAAMDETLERLRALAPARPDALLYAVAQQHLAQRADAARAALDSLLLRHGADPELYSPLSTVLVELGADDSLERIAAELRERGLSPLPVLWARLRLEFARRDWPAVIARIDSVRAASGPSLSKAQTAWLDTAARLARACIDGSSGTQSDLVESVATHPGTVRLYATLLEALLIAGRPATARQILGLAEGPYPDSETLTGFRPRIAAALAASAAAPAAPAAGLVLPGTADELILAMERRIYSSDTTGALDLLAAVRRARPDWLAAAEPALDAVELPLRARGDDPLRLRLLARASLARDAGAPERLLALAREIAGENPAFRPNALLLLKEILRHSPAHADSLEQLAAWEHRPARALLDATP